MTPRQRHLAGLFLLSAALFTVNLGGARLWEDDEPRNAACAVEMLERNDWVVPYFNGEVRDHKPVLLYWLLMTSYTLFGINEFAARLPSATLSIGTVILTYLLGRRLFGAVTGLLASVVLATSLMFLVASRASTPDATLIFFCTLALTCYVYSVWPKNADAPASVSRWFALNRWSIAAIYGTMGLAVLTKGPVGFVMPTAVIGMFLLIQALPQRQETSDGAVLDSISCALKTGLRTFHPIHFLRTCGRMKVMQGTFVMLAVALPWYVLVTIRSDWVWTRGFFLKHNIGRAMSTMENHGGPPLLYYIVALCCGFFPWSVLFGPWICDLTQNWNHSHKHTTNGEHAARRFTLCWVGVYVGVFSLASTKLPSYITPCYPALAILMGNFLERLTAGAVRVHRGWFVAAMAVLALVGTVMGVAVPLASKSLLPGNSLSGLGLGAIGFMLVLGAGVGAWLFLRGFQDAFVKTLIGVSVAFGLLAFAYAAGEVGKHQRIDELISQMQTRSKQPTLAAFGGFRSSWVFYARQNVPFLGEDRAEARQFLEASSDNFLVVPKSRLSDLEAADQLEVVSEIDWFLEQDALLLLRGMPKPRHSRFAHATVETR